MPIRLRYLLAHRFLESFTPLADLSRAACASVWIFMIARIEAQIRTDTLPNPRIYRHVQQGCAILQPFCSGASSTALSGRQKTSGIRLQACAPPSHSSAISGRLTVRNTLFPRCTVWTLRPSLSAFALFSILLLITSPLACAQGSDVPTTNAQAQTIAPPATPPRITQAIDEKNLVTLSGNVHPLARPEFDQGAVSDAMPMSRILLLLQRSPDQERALQQLLEQQQSKSSPNYHAWLTPQQFGRQFGPADADIQTITEWLASQGFSQIKVGPGRTVIEFSGNVSQVRSAFHTEIHRFVQNGQEHTANIADPQIPAALAPVVAGIVSLHNFPKKSHARVLGQFRRTIDKPGLEPLFTFPNPFGSGNFYGLGPGDFATIYNTKPLLAAGNDGTGQTIAIVGETNIHLLDVQQFRSMFALSANFTAANIILNGEDPGITSIDEEAEADLDVEWSGAVAPGATIKFVVSASTPASAGIDLSALYIIENNLAGVMSESYGACENALGAVGNAFYNNLWEQAAAQGITAVLSSGDGGSAGCDDFNSPQPAKQGLAVSGLASTPYNVSAGGTDFDQVNNWAAYWNSTNDATGTSAKSYIPEIPWNENCAQIGLTGCGASAPQGSVNIVAGSGGPSTQYAKPKWQLGVAGVPNDNRRDQPDISLFASSGFNGSAYIICQSVRTGYCSTTSGGVSVTLVGGTSASAPAFAAIMALVNQKQAALGKSPRQGNANNILYALAKQSGASCASSGSEATTCIFNDVSKGNSFLPTGQPGVATNSVPCQGGSPNCSVSVAGSNGVLVDPAHTTTEAWTATAGYDMTTGLGSVNANNLAIQFGNVNSVATTTTLTLSPTTGITHGSESVTVNISVTSTAGTGMPSGDVSLIATFSNGSTQAFDHFTLVSGAITGATTHSLPGGTYNVTAHYTGDGVNAPSDSAAVQVTVGQENSQTFIVVPTFDSNGNLTNGNATSVTYGSNYAIRMYVTNNSATASVSGPPSPLCAQVNQLTCPSGTVTLTGNGTSVDKGLFSLNNAGYTRDLVPNLAGGTYPLVATYSGDNSYSSSSATEIFTVTPAPTSITATTQTNPVAGQPFWVDIFGTAQVQRGATPTGTLTFFDGSNQLGSPVAIGGCGPGCISLGTTVSIATAGPHTLKAQYSGDTNYAPSSTSTTVTVLNPTTASISVNPTTVLYGNPVSITAIIDTTVPASNAALKPTPNVLLSSNVAGNMSTPSITEMADVNGNWEIQATATVTLQYTGVVSVYYNGDSNYAGSSATSTFITINIPDFGITVPGPLVLAAGQSGSVQVSVVPASNNPSPVTLSCGGNLPGGYTCSTQPNVVNLANGTPATATLTLSPKPAGQAIMSPKTVSRRATIWPPRSNPFASNPYWSFGIAAALTAFGLLLCPTRRRLLRPICVLATTSVLAFMFGCGGGSSGAAFGNNGAGGNAGGGNGAGGGAGGGNPSPYSTTTTVSTSSPSVPSGSPVTFTAKVTSQGNPTGTVTFFVPGVVQGWAPLNGGTATLTTNLPIPGFYQVTATYNGDASNSGSTSPAVNQAVTGTTLMQVNGQTGGLIHSANLTVTLQ
jgi:hypothetical protein